METNGEKNETTNDIGKKSYTDPITGKFVKGNPGGGRPAGAKNFETDFLEAVGKIAEANNITKVEAMEILLRKAYSEAKNGQFNFYKDIMDRLYGKVVDKTDITTKGASMNSLKDLSNAELESIISQKRISDEGIGEETPA